jgi:MiaB/RimO family radical SAM methylthiotransferase
MKHSTKNLCNTKISKNKTVFIKIIDACLRAIMFKDYTQYFEKNGFVITPEPKKADYIFVITCVSAKYCIEDVVKYVAYIKRLKKDNAKIIIAGCLPKIDKALLSKEKDVIQIGNNDELDDIFGSREKIRDIGSKNVYYPEDTPEIRSFNLLGYELRFMKKLGSRIDYYIKEIEGLNKYSFFHIVTNTGCSENCTYCAIKNAIGAPVSKPIETILKEFKSGLSLNFKKFHLSSDNMGLYNDKGRNLIDLLEAIHDINREFSIKLQYIQPSWFINNIDSFEKILAKKKIRAIIVPVQSGNDRILKKMGRDYKSEDIHACFKRLNSKFPFLSIRTQFIVGFPSETEAEFQDSVKFLDGLSIDPRLSYAVFEYSDMKNTASSRYKDKVSSEIKHRRQKILSRKMKLNTLYRVYNSLKYGCV